MQYGENTMTEAWKRYEYGKTYNNSLIPNVYQTVDTNLEFFSGNQWVHLPASPAMSKLPRPVFNIIKRITSLFVASLTSSATTVSFEPLSYYAADEGGENGENENSAVYANAEVRNLFEKLKLDYRIRDALFDGAVTGDYCAHFYWNPDATPYGGAYGIHRGEIEMELVDGINVMFGNPNITSVEKQPYILIIGRDTVKNLQEEANRFRENKFKIGKGGHGEDFPSEDLIQFDAETQYQAGSGGKIEIMPDDNTGKALYLYMYTKVSKDEYVKNDDGSFVMENDVDENGEYMQEKDGDGRPVFDMSGSPVYKQHKSVKRVTTVHVTKATKSCNIFEDVDTGLSRYPIAWGNWERQKNQYHGRALVTGIVPNQIFINSMMAMVFRHLQLQSFPKTVYNADLINQWNNEVGTAIGVRGMQPGQELGTVARILQPADMSNQIVLAIDKVMEYTKECLGATDAQMGNMRLDNTSALMVLQTSSEVPLENPRSILYEWVEDIAAILLDMMGTYYGKRPIQREREFKENVLDSNNNPVIDPVTGQMQVNTVKRRVMEEYDFRKLKGLWFNIYVQVGATTQYSEIAMVQTLDNLRRDGTLEIVDYLERIPDRLIPRKQELIDSLRLRMADAQAAAANMELARAKPDMSERPKGAYAIGGPIDPEKRIAEMPARLQETYQKLPARAQAAMNK